MSVHTLSTKLLHRSTNETWRKWVYTANSVISLTESLALRQLTETFWPITCLVGR